MQAQAFCGMTRVSFCCCIWGVQGAGSGFLWDDNTGRWRAAGWQATGRVPWQLDARIVPRDLPAAHCYCLCPYCGVSPAGHVITNYHVITDASDIQVTFMGGTEYSAKVVGFDQDKDIAVLQVGPKAGPALPEIKFDPVKGTATMQVGC